MGGEDDVESSHGVPSGGSSTISKPGVGIIRNYDNFFYQMGEWSLSKGSSSWDLMIGNPPTV